MVKEVKNQSLIKVKNYFFSTLRNHCIAWENPNFENAVFKIYLTAYERTSEENKKFWK